MDSLHFREYHRGDIVAKNESFPVVDVYVNEGLSDAIDRGERIQGNGAIPLHPF